MNAIGRWLGLNALIFNFNIVKTESLLFGTSQRLARHREMFNVMYLSSSISNAQRYKYLVIQVDSSLSPLTHLEKCYKRASVRLSLLAKARHCLYVSCAEYIYNFVILSTFTYCGILELKLATTQANRLASFHDLSLRTIQGNSKTKPVIQIFLSKL